MINNITTQRRAQRRTNNNSQTINSLCHTTLIYRVAFCNNCLGSYQQCAAANAL